MSVNPDCGNCFASYFTSYITALDADNCVSSCPNGVCYGECDKTHLTAIAALCYIADPYATMTTTTTTEEPTTTEGSTTTTEEETTSTGEESTTEGGEETTEDVTTDSGAMATGVAVAVVGVLAALL